jgi:intergrase/recombinase
MVLKNIHTLKIERAGDIAYINTEPLTKHTKQTFALFFPASFIEELKSFNPDTMKNQTYLKKKIQHGIVSVKTIRKWHFNVLRKKARIDSAVANFIHGRGQSNVGDDVYLEQIGFALEEYPKALPFIPHLDEASLRSRGTMSKNI